MRLINADKMRAEAVEPCKFCHLNGSKYCREKCEINALLKLIDNAPTECEKYRSFCMAKQRPQGKWINKYIGGNECVMCSECKLHFDIEPNYCPNCGAKMDEGKEGSS